MNILIKMYNIFAKKKNEIDLIWLKSDSLWKLKRKIKNDLINTN